MDKTIPSGLSLLLLFLELPLLRLNPPLLLLLPLPCLLPLEVLTTPASVQHRTSTMQAASTMKQDTSKWLQYVKDSKGH